MNIESIYPINGETIVARASDVSSAERDLGARFPDGYLDYITQLGIGFYTDLAVVWFPWSIAETIDDIRHQLMTTRRIWCDAPGAEYPESWISDSILLLETIYKDRVVFLRHNPQQLFLLPHDTDRVVAAGSTLQEALDATMGWRGARDQRTCHMLMPNGQFERADLRTFASMTIPTKVSYYRGPSVDVARVRSALIHLVRTAHESVLCVRRSDVRFGTWLELFIPECWGHLRWYDPEACDDEAAPVDIAYNASDDAWRMKRLMEVLEQAGYIKDEPPDRGAKIEPPEHTTIHTRLVYL